MNFEMLKRKKVLIVLLVIIVFAVGAYYFLVYQKNNAISQDPNQVSLAEAENLIEKIGRLIELPNEQPQIATVSDASKLPNQPFFKNAQNGDKVLIYKIAQKAILYRPSINKIIDVAPLAASQPTGEPNQILATPTATMTPSVIPTTKVPLLTPQPTQTQ